VGRRGARARPGPRGVGGGGGTSDWVSFHDEEERREEDEDKRRREVRASEWDNEFAFRATTFGQELFKRVDGLIGQLSRTIIREFSLVVSSRSGRALSPPPRARFGCDHGFG